jgi:hypothetical protein
MALFFERMLECAQKALDTADIVRDGDVSPESFSDPANFPAFVDLAYLIVLRFSRWSARRHHIRARSDAKQRPTQFLNLSVP